MILTTPLASAQIDVHSHMIPDSYLEAGKTLNRVTKADIRTWVDSMQ